MKAKKFLSMVLALAMIFTLCVSAFADDEFKATATVKIPSITVTVPQTGTLFINPMGFTVKIADGEAASNDDEANTKTNSKIVSPIYTISNGSPMKLDVNVIGSVTPDSANKALTIATAPISSDDTKNSVFIYTQFGAVTGDDGEETFSPAPAAYTVPADSATTFPQLALTTKVPTKAVNVGTVAAGGDDPAKFGFQFLGDCTANPKLDWNAGDKVEVNLIFSFKPNLTPDA